MSLSDPMPDSDSLDDLSFDSALSRLRETSQLDFELWFFGEILRRNPDFVDVLRCQGELLTRKGLHGQALDIDRRLVELLPDDCIVRYNLACSLAMGSFPIQAITELRKAFEQGYEDFEHLEVDRDLDSLRESPAYQELLRDFGIGN